jgi:hypothetical protein
MNVRIGFARRALPQLVLAVISPFIVAVVLRQIDTLLPSLVVAVAFAIVVYNLVRAAGLAHAFFRTNLRAAYEFMQTRVAQKLNGVVVKEIFLDEGMKVYWCAVLFQGYPIFSRVELPKGTRLREWADRPETIILPYQALAMKELSRYFERAVPV